MAGIIYKIHISTTQTRNCMFVLWDSCLFCTPRSVVCFVGQGKLYFVHKFDSKTGFGSVYSIQSNIWYSLYDTFDIFVQSMSIVKIASIVSIVQKNFCIGFPVRV